MIINQTDVIEVISNPSLNDFDKFSFISEFVFPYSVLLIVIALIIFISIGFIEVSTPGGKRLLIGQKGYLAIGISFLSLLIYFAYSLKTSPLLGYYANILLEKITNSFKDFIIFINS
ncbi:MAG: hypothetical protein Q8P20_07890 [bacterium]|nr:hypothetical protein [bacterium]